ncbi:hypothetical protein LY90DRAFT_677405 [Neocallimastix californiae]|uniref:Uncharacterized protein n=1 Tax=Neocallimastix californiae TaxID=1754190 RepID=A0A1Y2A4B8_9FUNG|nr:hypothetical protein LY90DRAFT_677405 [Neocallimastix californiae]|eukprot:ORY16865.1 hypothetical protein LY90DRAFT_677405 [Neocallimastix californiae]
MGKRRHSDSSSSDSTDSEDSSYSKDKHRKDKKDTLYEDALNSIPKISMKDYYNKNTEFQYWLKKKKHIYFSDLSTEKGKKYFKKVIKKWNNVELSQKYYEGGIKISNSERSTYKWNISKDDNEISRGENEFINDRKKRDNNNENRKLLTPEEYDILQIKREESNKNRYMKEKQERKKYRKEQKELLDELVPKPTGREAMLEKRKQITAFHRANAEKDLDIEYSDSELMGGDDIKERIRQRDKRNQKKEEMKLRKQAELNLKAEAYRKKEEETINMFRKMAEARFSKPN